MSQENAFLQVNQKTVQKAKSFSQEDLMAIKKGLKQQISDQDKIRFGKKAQNTS